MPMDLIFATATYFDGSQPEITFESSNTDVVGVKRIGTAKTGMVTANIVAIDSGEATVTAYCGNKSASIKVSVAEKSNQVRILMDGDDIESFEMFTGEQSALTAQVFPLESTDQVTSVAWKIVKDKNNKNVVSVAKGLVTAKKPGTAYIIVKSKQGEGQENIAVCKITVTTSVGSIKIAGTPIS